MHLTRGGSKIYPKGADFKNKVRTFLGRPNWFSELSQITIKTLFWQNFQKKRFEALSRKCPKHKNLVFFGARSPSKLEYFGAEDAFGEILVSQKWISQNSTNGGPFGSAGGPIPEGGRAVRQTLLLLPPNSAPAFNYKLFLWIFITDLESSQGKEDKSFSARIH